MAQRINNNVPFSWNSSLSLMTSSGVKSPSSSIINISSLSNQWKQPAYRSFIANTTGIFYALRSLSKDGDSSNIKAIVAKVSKLYRSALSQLNETSYTKILQSVEIVWHLCEILMIEPHSSGVLVQQLQQWAASIPPVSTELLNALSESGMEDESTFWKTLFTCIIHGQIEDACFILQRHKSWPSEDFTLMASILAGLPVVDTENNVSQFQFISEWKEWQDTVQQVLREDRFSEDTQFRTACLLLVGDSDEYSRQKHLFPSWYHSMVAKLAYTNPLAKISELPKLANETIQQGNFESDILNDMILSLFRLDLQSFIGQLASLNDAWWSSCHLTDLLFVGGQLQQYGVQHVDEMHDQLLSDFGTMLLSHKAHWEKSLLYLGECGTSRRELISEALLRIPCSTEAKALKVASFAEKFGVRDCQLAIYRTQSMKFIKQNKLGTALCWALRSQNAPMISRICEMILMEYMETGKIKHSDLLEGLGNDILISERLSFLSKYNDYLKLKHDNPQLACNLLLFLIQSRLAPKFFSVRLLKDAYEMLGIESVQVANIGHLQTLVDVLEEVCFNQGGALEEKVKEKLRCLCVTKMGDCLLTQMTGKSHASSVF